VAERSGPQGGQDASPAPARACGAARPGHAQAPGPAQGPGDDRNPRAPAGGLADGRPGCWR
jgi:hypothetical protein